MKNKEIKPSEPHLDAKTFQKPLDELTNTIALKVQREGPKHPTMKPRFVIDDIYYLLRQSHQTYNLFCFINADDRREKDVDYRVAYSAVILPLVRTMIDCLYNITAILITPANRYRFRESGIKQILNALDADQQRYGGDPNWDYWIAKHREHIDRMMRKEDITEADVKEAKLWPTLSAYLRPKKNTLPTAHQEFLKKLTFGFWQEYSGISLATFQGLLPIAVFFVPKDFPQELRPEVESKVEELISIYVPRVAAILLCTLTELQAHFKFDGARINARLHPVWNALLTAPEIKELYDERYAQLMRDKGINP